MGWTRQYEECMRLLGVDPYACDVCGKDCRGWWRMVVRRVWLHPAGEAWCEL